jgi:hypothetical protein
MVEMHPPYAELRLGQDDSVKGSRIRIVTPDETLRTRKARARDAVRMNLPNFDVQAIAIHKVPGVSPEPSFNARDEPRRPIQSQDLRPTKEHP